MRAAGFCLPLLIALLMPACGIVKKSSAPDDAVRVAVDGTETVFTDVYLNAEAQYLSGSGDLGLSAFLKLEKERPDLAAIPYRIACIYKDQKQFAEALFFIEKANKLDPKNRWYSETKAAILERQGSLQQAAEIYEQLLHADPAKAVFYREAARLYAAQGRSDKALEIIGLREQQFGLRYNTTQQKVQILKVQGRWDVAADEIQKLRNKYPDRASYLLWEAEICSEGGELDRAISLLRQVLQQNPDDPEAEALLLNNLLKKGETANLYSRMAHVCAHTDLPFGRKKPLLEMWQEKVFLQSDSLAQLLNLISMAHPEDASALEYCGDQASEEFKDSLAAVFYLQALEQETSFDLYSKAIQSLRNCTSWTQMQQTATVMTELYPTNAQAWYWRGFAAFQERQWTEAEEAVAFGINFEATPEGRLDFSALKLRVLLAQHKTTEVLNQAQAVYREYPDKPYAWAQWALACAETGKQPADAETLARKAAASTDPDSVAIQLMLGRVLFLNQKSTEAIRVWLAVTGPEKREPEFLETLGDAYQQTGNLQQARKYWQQALKAGGDAVTLQKKLHEP